MEEEIEMDTTEDDHIIHKDFLNTSIALDDLHFKEEKKNLNESFVNTLKYHFTGTSKFTFMERHFTGAFLNAMILAFKVLSGSILASVIIFITKIHPYLNSPYLAVWATVNLAKLYFGNTIRNIFVLISGFVGICVAVAFAEVSDVTNRYGTGAFIFGFTFFMTFSRYSMSNLKFCFLFFITVILVWTKNSVPGVKFDLVTYSLKLGLTLLIGFGSLFVAALIPLPISAKRELDKKIKTIIKGCDLMFQLSVDKFTKLNDPFTIERKSQLKAIEKIIESSISDTIMLLDVAQMESPFSDLSGYSNHIKKISELVLHLKGLMGCIDFFDVGSRAGELRTKLSVDLNNIYILFSHYMRKIANNEEYTFNKDHIYDDFILNIKKHSKSYVRTSKNDLLEGNMQDGFDDELSASYYFLMKLFDIGIWLREFKREPLFVRSFKPIAGGIKTIFTSWLFTSTKKSKIQAYLKSHEFRMRLLTSFLFGSCLLVGCLFVLIKPLAVKFYNSFPTSIATTAIAVFSNNEAGSFHQAKVRIGATLIANIYGYLALKLIIGKYSNPYSITAFATAFSFVMTIMTNDYPEVAQVASFVVISILYGKPALEADHEVFILNSIIQTFIGSAIIVVVFSWQWFVSSSRSIFRKNGLKLLIKSAFCIEMSTNILVDPVEHSHISKVKLLENTQSLKLNLKKQTETLSQMIEEPNLHKPGIDSRAFQEFLGSITSLINEISLLVESASGLIKDENYEMLIRLFEKSFLKKYFF
eukprot:TRINITY_DN10849_c0_g1_i2.p1 TRINITY_DN10849_c0_g1~~TRINITY_DN10849_c0_g1_i2.p1  ORF type:complete len:766 (-),score=94.85 TRINITY_DN10849_c0_g1_i2:378-2645(-)